MSRYDELQKLIYSVDDELKERERKELEILDDVITGLREYLGCDDKTLVRTKVYTREDLGDTQIDEYAVRHTNKWLLGGIDLVFSGRTLSYFVRVKFNGHSYDVNCAGATAAVAMNDLSSYEAFFRLVSERLVILQKNRLDPNRQHPTPEQILKHESGELDLDADGTDSTAVYA